MLLHSCAWHMLPRSCHYDNFQCAEMTDEHGSNSTLVPPCTCYGHYAFGGLQRLWPLLHAPSVPRQWEGQGS